MKIKYTLVFVIIFLTTQVFGQLEKFINNDNPIKNLGQNKTLLFDKNDTVSIISINDTILNTKYIIYDNSLIKGLRPVRYIEKCILKDSLFSLICKRGSLTHYWLYSFDKKRDMYILVNAEIISRDVGIIPTIGPRKGYFVSHNLISVNTLEKFSKNPNRKDIIVQYDTDWGRTIFEKKESKRVRPPNRN